MSDWFLNFPDKKIILYTYYNLHNIYKNPLRNRTDINWSKQVVQTKAWEHIHGTVVKSIPWNICKFQEHLTGH